MLRLPPALAASATPRILELLGEGPGRAIEIGFTGIHARPLELAGWEVVVVEHDPVFIARARERSANVVDRAEGRFDAAVAPADADLSGIDAARVLLIGADGSVRERTVAELRVVLTVADFEAALAFYRDSLGLPLLADFSEVGTRGVLLGAGRATLELFDEAQAAHVDAIEAGRRVSGSVRLGFGVPDSEATARRLVAAGADEVAPPVTPPWGGRNARLRAPDGMQLTLFSEP
jgi:catechol 2,3-dioxygenase-like lactoylglutathione lyase family enzyme